MISFHIAMGKIHRTIAELNLRIGYILFLHSYNRIYPILTFNSAIVL